MQQIKTMATNIFISYAHTDERFVKELKKHFSVLKRNKVIDTWTDRKIMPGRNWKDEICNAICEAQIILLLISSDFLASDYCYEIEMATALKQHKNGVSLVIPIIIRYCDWSNTPFSSLQALPTNALPINDWPDMDKGLLNVVEGIKNALLSFCRSDEKTISNKPLETLKKQTTPIKDEPRYGKTFFVICIFAILIYFLTHRHR